MHVSVLTAAAEIILIRTQVEERDVLTRGEYSNTEDIHVSVKAPGDDCSASQLLVFHFQVVELNSRILTRSPPT